MQSKRYSLICSTIFLFFSFQFYAQSPPPLPSSAGAGITLNYNTVAGIEAGFNQARRNEETILGICTNSIEDLDLPSQAIWDAYSIDEKALYLLNDERRSRAGVVYATTHEGPGGAVKGYPFSGIETMVDNAGHYWTDYLTSIDAFDHCLTSAPPNYQCPHERILSYAGASCIEGFGLENLWGGGSGWSLEDATVGAVFSWTYGTTGHRNGVLNQGYNDNYGNIREEGLVGWGITNDGIDQTIVAYKFVDAAADGSGCSYTWQAQNTGLPGCLKYLELTSQNTGTTLMAGSSYQVTWAKSSCYDIANISIKLSLDGGTTFPITLETSTSVADGTEMITIPGGIPNNTTTCRIRVESTGTSCHYFKDDSDLDFTITSNCLLSQSLICPADVVNLPAGDPGLNFNLTPEYFGSTISSIPVVVNGGSPTGQLVNRFSQANVTCTQNWDVVGYQTYDFKVTEAGDYTFCYGTETVMFSLFDGAGYVPASPCNNWLQANNWGSIGWTGCFTVSLFPCVDYQMVSFGAFGDVTSTIDVMSSGTGSIYTTTGGPGANYDYTYVAVNTATNLINAVSNTSDFTTLNGGTYFVYGAAYYNGGGTNPPPANPATWTNQTLAQILSSGDCVNFSTNIKWVTITGSICPPSYSLANGNRLIGVLQVLADFETDGIIESTQTIQLNPGNPGAAVLVDYDSGTSIDLLPNFEVKLGVVFSAFIDGCGGSL